MQRSCNNGGCNSLLQALEVLLLEYHRIPHVLWDETLNKSPDSITFGVPARWIITFLYYTSTKSWRGYIFTAVYLCLSVCLSVCMSVWLCLWTKFQPNGCIDLDKVFRYMVAFCTGSDPIEIGDLGLKVKVTVTQYPFILHNSLLTSLLYITAPLCLIKLKFGMPLTYALCKFVCEFH